MQASKDLKESDQIGEIVQALMTIESVRNDHCVHNVHCKTYIGKIVSHHGGWDKLKIRLPPTPMKRTPVKCYSKFQAQIQTSRGPKSLKKHKKGSRTLNEI